MLQEKKQLNSYKFGFLSFFNLFYIGNEKWWKKVRQPNLRLQKKKERKKWDIILSPSVGHWSAPPRCGVVQEVELPASLLWLTWRCITISLATQLKLATVAAPETSALVGGGSVNKRALGGWFIRKSEKSQGHSLLLGQWAHALLLPEEEAGPPMTWILLWQPCRHIRIFSALGWSYPCQWSVMSVHSPVLI